LAAFARYSDAPLVVPHSENAYDNAQLLELLAEAWQVNVSPLYAVRAHETVDWLLRDMRVTHGDDGTFAFASAYDADSEGVEGKYYVWSEEEIAAILGPDADHFKAAYGVTAAGNWEGVTILNRSHAGATVADDSRLAAARAKLLEARRLRVPPAWDDKVLADWNGLTIAALTNAGTRFGHPAWIHAARAALAFVARHMSDPAAPDRLFHSWRAGQARHAAVLDDYANLARAALALHQATGEVAYLERAEIWTATLDHHYWDDADGGYFLTADDADDLITRPKTIADHAVPPGNGTMVEVLSRLYLLTGKTAYRQRAEAILQAFSATTPEHNARLPTLCVGAEILTAPIQITILGIPDDPAFAELLQVARETAPPTAIISAHHPEAPLPPGHPATGKGLRDGLATAYVCSGATCGLPQTDARTLREKLEPCNSSHVLPFAAAARAPDHFEDDGAIVAIEFGRAPTARKRPVDAAHRSSSYFEGRLRDFSLPSPRARRSSGLSGRPSSPFPTANPHLRRYRRPLGSAPARWAALRAQPIPIVIPAIASSVRWPPTGYSGGEGTPPKASLPGGCPRPMIGGTAGSFSLLGETLMTKAFRFHEYGGPEV